MKKIAIVSCDKWKNKIFEDLYLKDALISYGVDCEIISWENFEQDLNQYDALILRSVWGYQHNYEKFKRWLLMVKEKKINLYNSPDIILKNILKDKQFSILDQNGIRHIETVFVNNYSILERTIDNMLNGNILGQQIVIKPTISGSGNNTYLLSRDNDFEIKNTITVETALSTFGDILQENKDCNIMLQPYLCEINNGEYSCIFIDGKLTHTMLRFPSVFHEKKKTYLISKPPKEVIELATKIESIKDYHDYLYMRIDMVLVEGIPIVMEVEMAEPDLLTRYIENDCLRNKVVNTFAKKIIKRI